MRNNQWKILRPLRTVHISKNSSYFAFYQVVYLCFAFYQGYLLKFGSLRWWCKHIEKW